MTSIGFTGTRKGMALAQWAKVDELLHEMFDVEEYEHEPYLARNREIVNASDLMIAAPFEYFEEMRGSGTWATIRYTQRRRKTLIIVWPNGPGVTERRR